VLSRRIRKSQLIVENQAQQLATSQQLNAHIISAMHPGVIVLDYHQQIRLINTAAKRLLGDLQPSIETVADLGVPFSEALQAWKAEGKNNIVKQMAPSSPEARLSFHPLGKGLPTGTLVFIYDADKETQHAQDLKLASLGQLTANIAHELRNPLGAVSHAAQLLGESKDLTSEDARLGNMIKQHCDRMNTVIQNVLSLSSRKPAHHQTISLVPWLEQFIKELAIPFIPDPQVTLHVPQQDILVHIDPTQFTQILINLCENGLRYSLRKNNEATLTIQVHCSGSPPKVFIDILDQGEGIPPSQVSHLFEPFFTTEQTGSGLGLYIARELSQMNGARLDYAPSNQGTQFRLTIPQGGASL
jgi:two-component system sensor histidine kinase PilS (NtrC family)